MEKLSLYLIKHHTEVMYGGVKYSSRHSSTWRCAVSFMLWSLFTRKESQYKIGQETKWDPEPIWTLWGIEKSFTLTRIEPQLPGLPAPSSRYLYSCNSKVSVNCAVL
jgi:hypothetical protein